MKVHIYIVYIYKYIYINDVIVAPCVSVFWGMMLGSKQNIKRVIFCLKQKIVMIRTENVDYD